MPLGPNTAAFFAELAEAAATKPQKPISDYKIEELRAANIAVFTEGETPLCGPLPDNVRDTDFARTEIELGSEKLPIVTYTPETYRYPESGTVIFFYGSGFTIPLLKAHFPGIATLANRSGCKVIAIDYLLAPEHSLTETTESSFSAVQHIFNHPEIFNINPDKLNIIGYSAGGNLSAKLVRLGIDRDAFRFKQHVLINPWLDLSLCTHRMDAYSEKQAEEKMLTTEALETLARLTLRAEEDPKSPELSPLYDEKTDDLPPTHIISAEYDGLGGDALAYAKRLDIEPTILLGQTHNFFIARNRLNDGKDPAEVAAAFLSEKSPAKLTS